MSKLVTKVGITYLVVPEISKSFWSHCYLPPAFGSSEWELHVPVRMDFDDAQLQQLFETRNIELEYIFEYYLWGYS